MALIPLLLMLGLARTPAVTEAPVLEFPQAGLDDTLAYSGYRTRFFRDTDGNTIQIVLNRSTGRIVNLWADAANESISFTAREQSGKAANIQWVSPGAIPSAAADRRYLDYTLCSDSPSVDVGLLLLCSMRKERDFESLGKHLLPFDSDPFIEEELQTLLSHLHRLPTSERERALAVLGARDLNELRGRLAPSITLSRTGGRWVITASQPTFDGKNLLLIEFSGDTTETGATISANTLSLRSRSSSPVSFTVRIGTNSPSLTPLSRDQIFNKDFLRYYDVMKARRDSVTRYVAVSPRQRGMVMTGFELLDRQVRSVELLSFQEKLLAGLPNYATYFGRDMMMSAMMMEPVLLPSMEEHVIESVLRKLSSEGKVSHEEALGGQAIRENAAVCNDLLAAYFHEVAQMRSAQADSLLSQSLSVLAGLQTVRENYHMVDETFQLPVLAGRYLSSRKTSAADKKAFLFGRLKGTTRLSLLMKNLLFVYQQSAPFAARPDVTSLVEFPRIDQHRWMSASWRDSGAGYADGRFAMDVNVIWVPAALAAMKSILATLPSLGISSRQVDSLAPELSRSPLKELMQNPSRLDRAIRTWRGSSRFFEVHVSRQDALRRLTTWLSWLPEGERSYWKQRIPAETSIPASITFLALSLDSLGHPIPVMNTDEATALFLEGIPDHHAIDTTWLQSVRNRVRIFTLPYPLGLFIEHIGPLVANDAYAQRSVWERFKGDQYHSPTVVWGREVNLFLLGVARHIRAADAAGRHAPEPLWESYRSDLHQALTLIRHAVESSGMNQSELWSYRINGGTLFPDRYASSCDIQLWNLTGLAVEYELSRLNQQQ